MNSNRSKKVRKSRSPGSMNKMFHKGLKGPHSGSKPILKKSPKKSLLKPSSKLNTSSHSKSSVRSISHSRSLPALPMVPGNDLKIIKEIFTKAKKYKYKFGQQKIPVKIMKPAKKSPASSRSNKSTRSIPKYKNSSNSVAVPSYIIGKCDPTSLIKVNIDKFLQKNLTKKIFIKISFQQSKHIDFGSLTM